MILEIHKATIADADNLPPAINDALPFKLSHGDTTWEEGPFTTEDTEAAIARDTLLRTVNVDGKPAGSVVLLRDDESNWGERA